MVASEPLVPEDELPPRLPKEREAEGVLRRGLSSPCIYAHNAEPSTGWRHSDDILFTGEEKFVDEILDKLKGEIILKKRAKLGSVDSDDIHCAILVRLINFKVNEMKLAYLSADLPHLQFCANQLTRKMSKPTIGHWNRLKRVARYLKTHGRWIQEYHSRMICIQCYFGLLKLGLIAVHSRLLAWCAHTFDFSPVELQLCHQQLCLGSGS